MPSALGGKRGYGALLLKPSWHSLPVGNVLPLLLMNCEFVAWSTSNKIFSSLFDKPVLAKEILAVAEIADARACVPRPADDSAASTGGSVGCSVGVRGANAGGTSCELTTNSPTRSGLDCLKKFQHV